MARTDSRARCRRRAAIRSVARRGREAGREEPKEGKGVVIRLLRPALWRRALQGQVEKVAPCPLGQRLRGHPAEDAVGNISRVGEAISLLIADLCPVARAPQHSHRDSAAERRPVETGQVGASINSGSLEDHRMPFRQRLLPGADGVS